jgi:hypothetical protein
MTIRSTKCVPLLAALAVGALTGEARAEQSAVAGEQKPVALTKVSQAFQAAPTMPAARSTVGPDQWPAEIKAIFVGVSGGVGFANVHHPNVGTPHVLGPMLAFQLGYRVTERWAVSLVYTDFQQRVMRASGDELFGTSTSWLRTAADCNNCKPPAAGGNVLDTTFRLSSLGPAVDVTPFGKNGPFLGVSGGVAMATLTGTLWGASGTARAGLRLRPVDNVCLGVEGGIQGQKFSGGSAALGYGGAEVRLNF